MMDMLNYNHATYHNNCVIGQEEGEIFSFKPELLKQLMTIDFLLS